MCLLDWIRMTDSFFWRGLSFLFSCPDRLYTITGSLRDTLPPKEAHFEMWDTVTLLCWTFCLPLSLRVTPRSHVIARAASPSSLVLPESYSLCLKPLRNTVNSQRLSLARGVVFSVVKHERHVLSSSITSAPSHTCYWLLWYNLNQIWNFYPSKICQAAAQMLCLFLSVFLG